jgi:hypothetical protein
MVQVLGNRAEKNTEKLAQGRGHSRASALKLNEVEQRTEERPGCMIPSGDKIKGWGEARQLLKSVACCLGRNGDN